MHQPSEGYMLCCSRSARPPLEHGQQTHKIYLLNPLNNHEIPLPAYKFGLFQYWFGPWQNQTRECIVCYGHADCYHHNRKLVLWHSCQDKWSELDLEYKILNQFYCKRMLFIVVGDTGVTKVMDIATGALVYDVPSIEGYSADGTDDIVEALGDILRVRRQHFRLSSPLCSEQFDVYRLDVSKSGSPFWIKVTRSGDWALFLD